MNAKMVMLQALIVAVFFGGGLGTVLDRSNVLDAGAHMPFWLLGLITGAVFGPVMGLFGRSQKTPRHLHTLGGILGLAGGLLLATCLIWQRAMQEQQFGTWKAIDAYLISSFLLILLVGLMGVLLGLILGWSVSFVLRLHGSLLRRLMLAAVVGLAGGGAVGVGVLGIIVLILVPGLRQFGGQN